jgi:hypothetical protein
VSEDVRPEKPSQTLAPTQTCSRCRGVPPVLRTMLDPKSGKTIRMFECSCGERSWSEE